VAPAARGRGMCNEHDAPLMRTLLLTGSPASPMASLQLADPQITAGPEFADAQTIDGRWLLLRTPAGSYDLAGLLDRIPANQQPEAIVFLIDDGWGDAPRNFRSFGGTKILLLADSVGHESDLSRVFRYVAQEPFDRVMFLKEAAQLKRFLAGAAPSFPSSLQDAGWPPETPSAQARAS
jgi:hypothetical protein